MSVNITVEKFDNYLIVKPEGERDKFADVLKGAQNIYQIAMSNNMRNIIVDCSNLIYKEITFVDAFNLVRYYERELPEFTQISIGAIASKDNNEIIKFWESICTTRGYNCKAFMEKENAKQWIEEIITQSEDNSLNV